MSIRTAKTLGEFMTATKLESPASEQDEAIKRLDAILEETRANAYSSCALNDIVQAFSLSDMDSVRELFSPDIPQGTLDSIMEALANVKKVKEEEK